jgi:hypothetical protein
MSAANQIKQEVCMKKQSRNNIGTPGTEHGTWKQTITSSVWIAACFLAITLLLPPTFCFAAPTDPREAAIVADLASGKDIAVIIQNAVAAGITADKAVTVLVAAGADAGRVVYGAISAGFPATDVVHGAAAAASGLGLSEAALLTQVTMIISSATQAGANPTQVNSGLSNAGIPATMIANANTLVASAPAPVYGYSSPTPTPPPAAGIGALAGGSGGGMIGGSGIGAPPTPASGNQNASPTRPNAQP